MNAEQTIRVLVVDDHPITREGITAVLSRQHELKVVGEAGTGREAVDLYRRLLPDVTLMDLQMPDMNGTQAIRAIRKDFPKARVIVLTTFAGEDDIYSAVLAGAKGYLLKDTSREQLIKAIVTVHSGASFLPDEVAMKLTSRITARSLTERELEVLDCMASGKSNQEIATALFISEGTVKSHVNNILSKLEVSDRTQAVTTGIRRGLVRLL